MLSVNDLHHVLGAAMTIFDRVIKTDQYNCNKARIEVSSGQNIAG